MAHANFTNFTRTKNRTVVREAFPSYGGVVFLAGHAPGGHAAYEFTRTVVRAKRKS